MRRAGLLVLVLASLSLTTAFAASFEVRAEDITSFSTPVEIIIDTPTTKRLYLVGAAPSQLSEVPASQGSSNVHTKSLKPGGVLADGSGGLASNADAETYHDWTSDPLGAVTIESPTVELYITQTGAKGVLRAGLFDCEESTCTLIAQATGQPGTSDPNLVVVVFPDFSWPLDEGDRLVLRVVNGDTKAYNIQWGYKENRPARLVLDLVPPG